MIDITQNPLYIGLLVAVYVVLLVYFKKNKEKVWDFMETVNGLPPVSAQEAE